MYGEYDELEDIPERHISLCTVEELEDVTSNFEDLTYA